ncbi:calpain-like cysteine peptidase putativecalpain-like cysteine peptidase Clan CA family C2 [Leptomonas pyrrhocoris]|uniref:Calpain-like cysteine peptidase putativecalpain-like cysteine peptidase Clan CA family C2 n=1 Tax=Leptomonas pyrrhocoris TaxID=157538 RepID=A0A0M9FT01_LEPPY|nr:calpain-like cysteine peptidase putativecalpain-like cysteine peptidase Clan CA family C2 [Leptomonas pyrrhocoris]KPA75246.1 calpain-like cysteine peptidase putativecalpain-like cysteine peptidase Clan CA family C2 [Leptomonas pyrrhocoris]|eukprot:XP_015653685.1 calpain-like cysteine peptidase putativecalpain-like cysteine peptidase Clan CA family C2 [Leptomonas pyrrhocoris]
MGGKSSKGDGEFNCGGPQDFPFDEKFPLFEKGNGLLFRLVDNKEKRWAFYSDSKKYEFHVTVNFGPNSRNLVALGNTYLAEDVDGGWSAKTIVYPGKTEPFIQGEVVGFDSVVNAVLLTTEYKERRKEEKKAEKKAAAAEEKDAARDELGSNTN